MSRPSPRCRAWRWKATASSSAPPSPHARIEDDTDGLLARETQGLLPFVAAGIAYRAVRQRGTLGGSLAHADPAADWVNTACLLDAGVRLARGGRVPATQFVQGPFTTALQDDDLLVAVDWPRLPPGTRWAYRKACRKPGEFAKALVAAWRSPAGATRLLLGALNGAPHLVQGDAHALRERAAQTALFDGLGLDDACQRQFARHPVEAGLRRPGRHMNAPGRSPALIPQPEGRRAIP